MRLYSPVDSTGNVNVNVNEKLVLNGTGSILVFFFHSALC